MGRPLRGRRPRNSPSLSPSIKPSTATTLSEAAAHASMLAHQGLITDDDRDKILDSLDVIRGQIERGEFVWRTDREDVHMNIEAALTAWLASLPRSSTPRAAEMIKFAPIFASGVGMLLMPLFQG